jgi:uncharacterized protein (DUF433 family)
VEQAAEGEGSGFVFTVPETVVLTGVSPAQLAYWRSDPVILEPSHRNPRPMRYSYEDVVALRMFAQVRGNVSLPKLRSAVATLRDMYPDSHLAAHRFFSEGPRTIVHLTADGDFIDLVERPRQGGLNIVMSDIYSAFVTDRGRRVPDLLRPTKGVTIDPAVRSGVPCADGSRVPYTLLASLVVDGLSTDEVIDFYPSVTREGVRGSARFAGQVAEAA